MSHRRGRRILALALLLCAAGCALLLWLRPWERPAAAAGEAEFALHMIDVGQGDALLLTCGGKSMLVDAGPRDSAASLCAYLRGQGIRTLDYVVLTHFHADHSGGLREVFAQFGVGLFLVPDGPDDEQILAYAGELAGKNGCALGLACAGCVYPLAGAEVSVLSPEENADPDEENARSLVLLARYDKIRFLLTGDAPAELLEGLRLPRCDLLKVSHHGSTDGTSAKLLSRVSPAYAFISCGAGNEYGHPHESCLRRLTEAGAQVWRTDQQGTCVAAVTGGKVRVVTVR
jgi:competence protein ComEC